MSNNQSRLWFWYSLLEASRCWTYYTEFYWARFSYSHSKKMLSDQTKQDVARENSRRRWEKKLSLQCNFKLIHIHNLQTVRSDLVQQICMQQIITSLASTYDPLTKLRTSWNSRMLTSVFRPSFSLNVSLFISRLPTVIIF